MENEPLTPALSASDGAREQRRGEADLAQGAGVSPDEIARLGDRFHRAAGQVESGSGLGLSIVRRIAALHGLEVRFGNRRSAGGSAAGLRVELRRRGTLAPA